MERHVETSTKNVLTLFMKMGLNPRDLSIIMMEGHYTQSWDFSMSTLTNKVSMPNDLRKNILDVHSKNFGHNFVEYVNKSDGQMKS
jgi:hypothetical protein